jgi:hypothetical protein
VGIFTYQSLFTVHITCGTRGDVVPPQTLDDVKEFTRQLAIKEPTPDWFYQFLDVLAEVEDTMTCSSVRVGKPSSTSESRLDLHPLVAPTTYIRYHGAPYLPRNWIAIGDSIMSVNPVFG